MKTIEFTDQEIQAMLQLFDIAVRAQGLGVAEAAVLLHKKLVAAQVLTNTEVTDGSVQS